MNDMLTRARAAQTQGASNEAGSVYAAYSFDRDGGAVSAIALGAEIPANSVITDITTYVNTALGSGGTSTVQLDLIDPLGVAPAIALVPNAAFGAIANGITHPDVMTTAEMDLIFTIGTDPLTAGVVTFKICYDVMG